METQARIGKSLHPLTWVASIALILFSAVGIGAFMGWIPTSLGKPDEPAVAQLGKRSPVAAQPAPAKVAPSPAQPAVVAAKCSECGVIQSVREIETKGEGSGIGAAGGAVVGGVLGHQVGSGDGKKIMTAVGAVGGAVAGNEIEKRIKSSTTYEITVRFDDGSSRVISEAHAPTWRAGDKVKVINGVIQSNA